MIWNSLVRRTALKKQGKKGDAWEKVRRALKPKFERAGIVRCELNFPQCMRDNFLGFAHAKKRRHLGPGELGIVIVACQHCHADIESRPESEMECIVLATIAARETPI